MPGVETSPIGSGSPPTAVSHASPPSASLTSLGAFSWNFSGSQFCQMSGGSRMWQSASTMRYLGMPGLLRARLGSGRLAQGSLTRTSGRRPGGALRGGVTMTEPLLAGVRVADPAGAPDAVWARVTPFGGTGPHSGWRASDLAVMAASGNMYATGDPDRPPVRCSEPSGYAHVGAETAFAVLTALASGFPHRVDISMQEVVFVANMVGVASFAKTGHRGARGGANISRTREIWPCKDGWVSFGLRGGKARVPSLTTLARLIDEEDGIDARALTGRDWSDFSHTTASDDELKAIEQPVAQYLARHTMQELYEIACETNLMLAPCNSPREIYASAQLAAREFFGPVGDVARFPRSFVIVSSRDGDAAPAGATRPAPGAGAPPPPA